MARAYNTPAAVQTDLPCSEREDFLSGVRIASHATCIDRTAVCNAGTKMRIRFSASCASRAAKKQFEAEVEHVVYFLSRRPS